MQELNDSSTIASQALRVGLIFKPQPDLITRIAGPALYRPFAVVVSIESVILGGVLFVFTATSPFCLATLPVWKGLADSAKGFGQRNVMVVGLGLDSATTMVPFSARHALNYPVAVLQQ